MASESRWDKPSTRQKRSGYTGEAGFTQYWVGIPRLNKRLNANSAVVFRFVLILSFSASKENGRRRRVLDHRGVA